MNSKRLNFTYRHPIDSCHGLEPSEPDRPITTTETFGLQHDLSEAITYRISKWTFEDWQMVYFHRHLFEYAALLALSQVGARSTTFLWMAQHTDVKTILPAMRYWQDVFGWLVQHIVIAPDRQNTHNIFFRYLKWRGSQTLTELPSFFQCENKKRPIGVIWIELEACKTTPNVAYLQTLFPFIRYIGKVNKDLIVVIRNINQGTFAEWDSFPSWTSLFVRHVWMTPPSNSKYRSSWLVLNEPTSTPAASVSAIEIKCECKQNIRTDKSSHTLVEYVCPNTQYVYKPSTVEEEIGFWSQWNSDRINQMCQKAGDLEAPKHYYDWRDIPVIKPYERQRMFECIGKTMRIRGHWSTAHRVPMARTQSFETNTLDTIGFAKFQYSDITKSLECQLVRGRQPVYMEMGSILEPQGIQTDTVDEKTNYRNNTSIASIWKPTWVGYAVPPQGAFCAIFRDSVRVYFLWPDDTYTAIGKTNVGLPDCMNSYCSDETLHSWTSHLPQQTGLLGVLYGTGVFIALDTFLIPGKELIGFTDAYASRQTVLKDFVSALGIKQLTCALSLDVDGVCELLASVNLAKRDIFIYRGEGAIVNDGPDLSWLRLCPYLTEKELQTIKEDHDRVVAYHNNSHENRGRGRGGRGRGGRGRGGRGRGRGGGYMEALRRGPPGSSVQFTEPSQYQSSGFSPTQSTASYSPTQSASTESYSPTQAPYSPPYIATSPTQAPPSMDFYSPTSPVVTSGYTPHSPVSYAPTSPSRPPISPLGPA